ncbi:hypothetical protein AVEN_48850-1 [Araneus ventricosus]|uniref:Uncharacterized protein n=1 Tax=Araneus ventricosus TaxID=182803 RepID=A0A4Y2AGC0_ARAVE|nr:hypothetical protein AVEN_48850-1 [Araneus ventricosus]
MQHISTIHPEHPPSSAFGESENRPRRQNAAHVIPVHSPFAAQLDGHGPAVCKTAQSQPQNSLHYRSSAMIPPFTGKTVFGDGPLELHYHYPTGKRGSTYH